VVQALCYKPDGRGSSPDEVEILNLPNSKFFQPHYGPVFDSACNGKLPGRSRAAGA
jgi:hypothetical protein